MSQKVRKGQPVKLKSDVALQVLEKKSKVTLLIQTAKGIYWKN